MSICTRVLGYLAKVWFKFDRHESGQQVMGAELGHHLGQAGAEGVNHRNGSSAKTVISGEGAVQVDIPRDRNGSFAPILILKHERRFTGFDDKIIAIYARGMTMREIQGFLQE